MMRKQSKHRVFLNFAVVLLLISMVVGCASNKEAVSGSGTKAQAASGTPAEKKAPKPVKFPTQKIELLVGATAGGGFDTWARALAPFLEKYLPDDYPVVVTNMPGAGGRTATEFLAKAKPDGHTILLVTVSGMAATQMVEKVGYDLNKLTWIGQVSNDVSAVAVGAKSPYNSLQDIVNAKKEVVVATKGITGSNTIANG